MAVEKTTESVGMKITVNHGEREGKVPSFIQVAVIENSRLWLFPG